VATRVRMIGGKRRKRLEFGWHGPGTFADGFTRGIF
jgi:hypothetical protein